MKNSTGDSIVFSILNSGAISPSAVSRSRISAAGVVALNTQEADSSRYWQMKRKLHTKVSSNFRLLLVDLHFLQ